MTPLVRASGPVLVLVLVLVLVFQPLSMAHREP
jgi:hypothetical protein